AAYLTKPARSAVLLGTVISSIQKARAQIGKAHFVREPVAATAKPAIPAFTVIRSVPVQPVPVHAEGSPFSANGPVDILIAEDNEINQLVFGQILNGLGLSYRIAGNGRTLVEMYRALTPRLILMDVSM